MRPEIGIRKLIKVEILHLKYLNKYLYGFNGRNKKQTENRYQIWIHKKNYTVYILADKRSSTGNLFFTDQFDNHPWEAPPELQPPGHKAGAWPQQRRRNLSSLSQDQAGAGAGNKEAEDRDPAATLQAMAGELQRNEYSTLVYLNLINWSNRFFK